MLNTVCDYSFLFFGYISRCIKFICGCCILFFISFPAFNQEDTTQFNDITIYGSHTKIEEHENYSREEILRLAPADLGVLLKRVAGASVADYGGVGSLKTMSIRGLGSTHTGLLINSYPVNSPQNSQIDFGRVQLENIESASVQIAPESEINIPVSSKMKGNIVSLQTFEQTFTNQPFALRSSAIIGSFGRKETHASMKFGTKNSFLSLSGNYRSYIGDFSYTLPFDTQNTSRIRTNNNMSSYMLAIGAGKKWKSKNGIHHRTRIFGNLNYIDRSLPGAIILYNSTSNENLLTETKQIGGDYSLFGTQFSLRSFASISSENLRYQDPSYLNNVGFIDNQYQNHSYETGINGKYTIKNFNFLFGNDVQYSKLYSSRNLGNPARLSNVGMIGSEVTTKFLSINSSVFHHFIRDENLTFDHAKNYQRFNPQLSLSTTDKLIESLQLSLWYKRSSRAPSFNELYYSQIGNTSLSPEESEQFNVGYAWIWERKSLTTSVSGNIFYNQLNNKIVALPTQNLFVWSIQNVGEVESFGKDITLAISLSINNSLEFDFSSATTYQSVRDMTDRGSPSYGHQIANTPKWTNASDIQLNWNQFSAGLSSLFIGKRYALNENIAPNELEHYLIFNFNLGYELALKQTNKLFFQAGVKNLMNQHYFHINYFVMPGRNFFLKISYEL